MALIEKTADWRYVFANYDRVTDRLPNVGELVYVSYIGIFSVDNVHKNGDIDVSDGDRKHRFPTSYYRVVIRK